MSEESKETKISISGVANISNDGLGAYATELINHLRKSMLDISRSQLLADRFRSRLESEIDNPETDTYKLMSTFQKLCSAESAIVSRLRTSIMSLEQVMGKAPVVKAESRITKTASGEQTEELKRSYIQQRPSSKVVLGDEEDVEIDTT